MLIFFLYFSLTKCQIKLCIYPNIEEELCPDGYLPTPVDSIFNFENQTQNIDIEIYISQTSKTSIYFKEDILFDNCTLKLIGYQNIQNIVFNSLLLRSNLTLENIHLERSSSNEMLIYNLSVSNSIISMLDSKINVSEIIHFKDSSLSPLLDIIYYEKGVSLKIEDKEIETITFCSNLSIIINNLYVFPKDEFKSIDFIKSGDFLNIEYFNASNETEIFETDLNSITFNTDCYLTFYGWDEINKNTSQTILLQSNNSLYITNSNYPTEIFQIPEFNEIKTKQDGRYCIIPFIDYLSKTKDYDCDYLFKTKENKLSNYYFNKKEEKNLVFILFSTEKESPLLFDEFNIDYNYHFISSHYLDANNEIQTNDFSILSKNSILKVFNYFKNSNSETEIDDKDYLIIESKEEGINLEFDSIEVTFNKNTNLNNLTLSYNSLIGNNEINIDVNNKLALRKVQKEDILNSNNKISTKELLVYPKFNDQVDLTADYSIKYDNLKYIIDENVTLSLSKPNNMKVALPNIDIINPCSIILDPSIFKENGPILLAKSLKINVQQNISITFFTINKIDPTLYKFLPKPNEYIKYKVIPDDEDIHFLSKFQITVIDICLISAGILLLFAAAIFTIYHCTRLRNSRDIQTLLVADREEEDENDIF